MRTARQAERVACALFEHEPVWTYPMVRFGFKVPSIRKRISARTSLKRYVRNSLGLKAPRGWGWLTNPRKAAYNRVYNRATRGCLVFLVLLSFGVSVGLVV